MRTHLSRCFALVVPALLLCATRAEAQTYNLDFSGLGGDGALIPASYGDVAGVIDVSIGHRAGWGNTSLMSAQAYHWTGGYNDLMDVAYTISGNGVGEVTLANLASGSTVTLNSANVGAWAFRAALVDLRVFDAAWNQVYASSGTTTANTHVAFSPGSTDLSLLHVQWSADDGFGNPIDAYNIGIDDVNFTVAAVVAAPEPASLTLFATGFLAFAGVGARRRSR